jgi:hypothetical protein
MNWTGIYLYCNVYSTMNNYYVCSNNEKIKLLLGVVALCARMQTSLYTSPMFCELTAPHP